MKLSIVIVNYNVRHFLEQCLRSVERAMEGLDVDVWVVDNDSRDDSMKMVSDKFPWVHRIENKENVGFAVANNQAANQSKGDYILLLNPDTILPEDNLRQALEYMSDHPKCGALGIRMFDGAGIFLPESKRGLPTPWVAFYKIFGLSSIFPKSKKFARYHLGHLSNDENHRVEILAGAYMLMSREAWNKAGGLDETYFMYGEDIDLSYSIEKSGFEVHYMAEPSIIHYKGESTKKGSLNYVFLFYNAMLIFARKHLSKGYARMFSLLIRLAIYLRAGVSVAKRIVQRISLPIIDLLVFTGGMQVIIKYWESNHRFIEGGSYPDYYKWGITPLYGALWIIGLLFLGGYRKPIQLNRILMGLVLGTGLIFGMYALSPDDVRFSRALILLGAAWMAFGVLFLRFGLSLFPSLGLGFWKTGQTRAGFVGKSESFGVIKSILSHSGRRVDLLKSIDENELDQMLEAFDLNEVIFDAEHLSYSRIIELIRKYSSRGYHFQIAYPSEGWIIGSNSIHTQGETVGLKKYALASADSRRSKRTFDLSIVVFLWILTPVAIWMPRLSKLWWNSFAVLIHAKTWVGYAGNGEGLPTLKMGVIPIKQLNNNGLEKEVDEAYASTADINTDARTLVRFIRTGA
ncbi:glycosyltransferase family 2 protein [Phaeocystidibacter luteus]|uniref:glycosyltransferase family 2 protein n=1 Tax=Phaeocystidibacter luteus TaxID=911197 RepID=UPI001479448A|nr:glycosyltransferase family 2 protein [Phaeocystidibacter luteus]